MKELDKLPLWAWLLIALILLTQSTWLFVDARRRGSNSWFWGIWGIIQAPIPLLVYLFLVCKIHKSWFREK